MVTSVGAMLPTVAQAAPPVDPAPSAVSKGETQADDLPNPLEDKRRALRTQAVSDVVSGKAKTETRNGSTVVKIGKDRSSGRPRDQYVELAREKTDRIFVILAEFGDERDARFPDRDTNPK